MRELLIVLFSIVCMPFVRAQRLFLDELTAAKAGAGVVCVVQDAEITRLVNGAKVVTGSTAIESSGVVTGDGEEASERKESEVRKMKATGWRVQVYAGAGSRMARKEAQDMGAKVKNLFPEMEVYTHFQSPRWLCRVGDFKTYEEADRFLHEIRAASGFDEAMIVKSIILIPY